MNNEPNESLTDSSHRPSRLLLLRLYWSSVVVASRRVSCRDVPRRYGLLFSLADGSSHVHRIIIIIIIIIKRQWRLCFAQTCRGDGDHREVSHEGRVNGLSGRRLVPFKVLGK